MTIEQRDKLFKSYPLKVSVSREDIRIALDLTKEQALEITEEDMKMLAGTMADNFGENDWLACLRDCLDKTELEHKLLDLSSCCKAPLMEGGGRCSQCKEGC